ncbi:SMI1/KNR4 family protein [Streptomyces coacervatus]|nr:SMI1/KNR4 family protein [Streptomyces coacervatus]MDF2269281.1 SMI1/KNR4 family protein [Streptomyces coacervatus]
MTDDIQRLHAAWARIEGWLREHAPASAASLRSPASEEQIATVENAIGYRFPPTLRAWYQLHDGVEDVVEGGAGNDFLPEQNGWLPLDIVQEQYRLRTEGGFHGPGAIPFCYRTGDGWWGYYVEAREGEPSYGNLGAWSADSANEPYPYGTNGWPLADWLDEIASSIEERRCLQHPDGSEDADAHPALSDGGLIWADPDDLPDDAQLLRDV